MLAPNGGSAVCDYLMFPILSTHLTELWKDFAPNGGNAGWCRWNWPTAICYDLWPCRIIRGSKLSRSYHGSIWTSCWVVAFIAEETEILALQKLKKLKWLLFRAPSALVCVPGNNRNYRIILFWIWNHKNINTPPKSQVPNAPEQYPHLCESPEKPEQ
jgi:hypothetical protein